MMFILLSLIAFFVNAPLTGDTFPAKLLIIVAVIAAAAAVLMTVFGKKKKSDDEDGE